MNKSGLHWKIPMDILKMQILKIYITINLFCQWGIYGSSPRYQCPYWSRKAKIWNRHVFFMTNWQY